MELFNIEPIFKIIDDLNSHIGKNQVLIKFHNYTDWTEVEFNNLINTLRNNYKETIEEEFLEVIKDDIILKIFKITNILSYCNRNDYVNTNHKWEKRLLIDKKNVNDLFDINLEFEISTTEEHEGFKNISNDLKKFRLVKNFRYELDHGIIAYCRIVKTDDKEFIDLKKSKILTSSQKYEFELLINNFNQKHILSTIILIM